MHLHKFQITGSPMLCRYQFDQLPSPQAPQGFCTKMCAQPQGFCTTENALRPGQ